MDDPKPAGQTKPVSGGEQAPLEKVLENLQDDTAALIENMPGIVLGLDKEGAVQATSSAAARLFGPDIRGVKLASLLDSEVAVDVTPDGLFEGVVPDDPGKPEEPMRLRLRSISGEYLLLEGSLGRTGRESGPCSFILNLLRASDSEAKAAQLAEIIEGSVQGLVLHRKGRPLFCNSAMAEMLGFDSREAVLQEASITPFIHEEDRDMVFANIRARLEGKEAPRSYEFRMRSLNGAMLWVDCRASVVEWEGGPAVLAACFDITDRKKAEEARRHSDELFSRVFSASPDFIMLTRLDDSVFINVNKGFLDTFGYTREEVIGKSGFDLGVWAGMDQRQRVLDAISNHGMARNVEVRGRTKSGKEIDILMSADILDFDDQKIFLTIGRDIADRKTYEAELMASKEAADLANKSKSGFLANMSHELRTPLNAILGFSEIIKNQILGPIEEVKYTEYARDIYESGAHLLDIINDILDLSKVEAGRLEVHENRVEIAELIGICQRLMEPKVVENDLNLEVEVSEGMPDLMADHRLMKQIVLNLLSNAIKFTPEGGRIRVSAALDKSDALAISVEDTGIGMDEQGVERALTPFGQVDTSFSRKHQGSGLGLPLVIAFTERQGGTFDLDTVPGEGTRITIAFPAEKLCA